MASTRFSALHRFKGESVCSATQFSRQEVECLLDLAQLMKQLDETPDEQRTDKMQKQLRTLEGKIMCPLFFENSTRTFASFCAATQKLGGSVSYLPLEASSIAKGETLEDTVRTVDCYADVICLRHPQQEALGRACNAASHPILNCGNGVGEHPSQSLLDAFTMKTELGGSLDGLTVALLGDLKNGRTVHSLSKLLSLFKIAKLFLLSPEQLQMPADVIQFLKDKGVEVHVATAPTPEILAQLNVLYVTRIQRERFANPADYDAVKGCYVVDKEMLKHCQAPGKFVVMHPLPRVDEISTEIDDDPRAAYFRQMKCGLHLRMAMLVTTLGKTGVYE